MQYYFIAILTMLFALMAQIKTYAPIEAQALKWWLELSQVERDSYKVQYKPYSDPAAKITNHDFEWIKNAFLRHKLKKS